MKLNVTLKGKIQLIINDLESKIKDVTELMNHQPMGKGFFRLAGQKEALECMRDTILNREFSGWNLEIINELH